MSVGSVGVGYWARKDKMEDGARWGLWWCKWEPFSCASRSGDACFMTEWEVTGGSRGMGETGLGWRFWWIAVIQGCMCCEDFVRDSWSRVLSEAEM